MLPCYQNSNESLFFIFVSHIALTFTLRNQIHILWGLILLNFNIFGSTHHQHKFLDQKVFDWLIHRENHISLKSCWKNKSFNFFS